MTLNDLINCLESRKTVAEDALDDLRNPWNDFAKHYSKEFIKGMLNEINNTLDMLEEVK